MPANTAYWKRLSQTLTGRRPDAPPPDKESNVDVLILGAGPAGLSCANALAKAKVKVRIVDKLPTKITAGHADGIQSRTLEIMQSYGIADRLVRESHHLLASTFWSAGPNGRIERDSDLRPIQNPRKPSPFPGVTLNQSSIEDIFLDSMQKYDLNVERPIAPSSILVSEDNAVLGNPDNYAVKVVLRPCDSPDGQTEIVHAKFVVGADGAHSWVRKALNIDMEGDQTEYIWAAIDMVPKTDFPDLQKISAIKSKNGSCMVIPRERDLVRVYVQLSDTDVLDPATGRVDHSKVNPEQILEIVRKSTHPYTWETPDTVDWWTVYIIGQRVASKFSVNDRVFIVGDACHTHSPKAGQGMNASICDSHNLAWKIAQVLRGWSKMSLLETYSSERRKFAQDLINFDKVFSAIWSGELLEGDEQMLRNAFQQFQGFLTGIGVKYEDSAIVKSKYQAYATEIVVGERMPPQKLIRVADARPLELQDMLPADLRFKVLIFTGDTNDDVQRGTIKKLAEDMGRPESFLNKFAAEGDPAKVFDIISISSGSKSAMYWTDMPALFRSHWSKVFVDDVDMMGEVGGQAYKNLGIQPSGAVIIVRPDGYVGFVCPFDAVYDIDDYFCLFMKS